MPHPQIDPSALMSETQFFAWAELREERYELVEGIARMQAGATREHERVAKQIFAALLTQVDASAFGVNKGDFGVRIQSGHRSGSILYPDVVVDLQSKSGSERATETPIVVVEVLSQSTNYDHAVAKLERYKLRPSLRHYLVFEQTLPQAYVWTRTDHGSPSDPKIVEGPAGVIALAAIEAELRLAEIYRKPARTNQA